MKEFVPSFGQRKIRVSTRTNLFDNNTSMVLPALFIDSVARHCSTVVFNNVVHFPLVQMKRPASSGVGGGVSGGGVESVACDEELSGRKNKSLSLLCQR